MAGTWMSIVKGFGGMTVQNNQLHFKPFLPKQWNEYSFKINFRENHLEVIVNREGVQINNLSIPDLRVNIHDKSYSVKGNSEIIVK
jgi:maltose phosphorylase